MSRELGIMTMNGMMDLSVSAEMHEEIHVFLDRLEKERGIRILYACESGSRAWGFASPDSDYDIRFIYTRPASGALSVEGVADTVELPVIGDLDAGGWDVKKSLSLLRKSNGALIEWLHSPIVYRAVDGFLDQWRGLTKEILAERALVDHYRGLAVQMWRGKLQGEKVRAKSYLYCLRAVLSAEWVIQKRENPPVPFAELLELLDEGMSGVVDHLLAEKSKTGEKEEMERVEALDTYLQGCIESEIPDDLSRPGVNYALLDRHLHLWVKRGRLLNSVKEVHLERAKEKDLLLFRSVAGSQAYGTSHAGSDVDYRGVFALPQHLLGGMEGLEQVQDERGDDVLYELGKVMTMLQKNNPNMMELLYMPEVCVEYRHAVWDLIDPEVFLSKKCELSFANYAIGQVKKARGLNKKIVNPEPEVRKTLVDFCYVMEGQGSVALSRWVEERCYTMDKIGLVSCQHAPNVYGMYWGENYRGVFSPKAEDELICSSVDIEAQPVGWMVCNVDAYKKHCKQHKEYWSWVKNRNEDRYQVSNERGYDAKNMMHTLRLLDVAEEIAVEGLIRVRRPNRDFLMQVRSGEMEYERLLAMAEEKMERVRGAYEKCSLPEEPDYQKTQEILMEMREALL